MMATLHGLLYNSKIRMYYLLYINLLLLIQWGFVDVQKKTKKRQKKENFR